MDTRELHRAADAYLVRNRLLSDVVLASEGPIFGRAEGSMIWDTDGKSYLDFNSGQMCSALGHNNPRVTKAVQECLTTLTHASSVYYNIPQIELAKMLGETLDAPLKRSMFIQSGADSNEGAILFARRATGRMGIAAFHLSFHGYSDVTRAISYCATGPGYGPTLPNLYAIPTPYAYRAPDGGAGEAWWQAQMKLGFELLDRQCPGNLAGVIVEPLISAGGVIDLPQGYLAALQKEVHARGALLIFDEAQTGLGKLGSMFAYQHERVVPDIMTLSKHFGGGLALSATITSDDIEEKVLEGGMTFGHSHSADPVSCAAGLASLEEIIENRLPEKARQIGAAWQSRIREKQKRLEMIGDIRGRGLLQGVEIVRDPVTKEPAPQECESIFRTCLEEGLLFSVRGPHKNVLRFVPPFTTTEQQLDQATEILAKAIGKAFSGDGGRHG
jgi:2,2-dialkylglycine decarboxylase (pyruvate)